MNIEDLTIGQAREITQMSNRFLFYDAAGRQYQLTPAQVAAKVKKHGIPKRRIYGDMAVDSDAWRELMQSLGIPLAPGYKLARPTERRAPP